MHLGFKREYEISDIRPGDEPAYVEYMRDREIYERTLNIPFPYTLEDARWWVDFNLEEIRKLGQSVNWAIRRADGSLIGGIGYPGLELGKIHRAEIGYWLAKPFWGQGLMTAAVQAVVPYAFERLGLSRVTAHVFASNVGSARVLEKAGFQLEGQLRRHYLKDGAFHDSKVYAILKE